MYLNYLEKTLRVHKHGKADKIKSHQITAFN